MRREITNVMTVEILDENIEVSLVEICKTCDVHAEFVLALIEEGFLEPIGASPELWQFSGRTLHRVKIAARLAHDFKLPPHAVALVVELTDELKSLRERLEFFENHYHKP